MSECGDQSVGVVIKMDQEAAIRYLVKDIVAKTRKEPGCRTIVEESPVASSGSNGIVERAVQTIEGQIRVMKLALEDRIGVAVDAEANVVTFMAQYAGYLVNRLQAGEGWEDRVREGQGQVGDGLGH